MLEFKDLVSISGKSGLYKIIAKRTNGLIVESIDEKKKRFPTSARDKVSVLEEISIFTYEEDLPLREVFIAVNHYVTNGGTVIKKGDSSEDIRAFFEAVLPNHDKERVFISDILRLANWYALLQNKLDFNALAIKSESDDTESNDSDSETQDSETDGNGEDSEDINNEEE